MIEKITTLISKLNTNIADMKIKGTPRAFLFLYMLLFLIIGQLYVIGLLYDFYKTDSVNYNAINSFANVYFGTSVVATFVIIGKALIDKDGNNVPDEWEKKEGEK